MTINLSAYSEEKYNPASDFIFDSGTIKEYIGSNPVVNIPEIIDGVPVHIIDENAFYRNNIIKTVTIPSSVYEIRRRAFQDCSELKEIYMSLSSIAKIEGEYGIDWNWAVFSGCTKLETVVIETGIYLSMDYGTFQNCRNLTTVTLPRNINASWGWCFDGCTKLKTINFRGDETEWPYKNNKSFIEAVKNGLVVNYNYIGD